MVKQNFPIRDIKGLTPAIDARNSNETFVLSGRNYLFDSRGPKAGFGTRLIAGLTPIEVADGVAQSIAIGRQTFVATSLKIHRINEEKDGWDTIYDLNANFSDRIDPWRKRWTAAYLSKGIYLSHYDYGLFKWTGTTLNRLTQDNTLGLPNDPISVAETNGRLIILSKKFVTWSAPSNAEYLIPELAGAGQQRLSDRVSGVPFLVTGFQQGFLVWTNEGCLIAEYIGGDTVFRFDRMTTEQLPLGPWAVAELPDGSQLLCTKQGIHRTDNGREPEPITPVFNEFIRGVLEHEDFIQIRLNYFAEQDLLFVQLRDWTNHYVRTYVLSVSLDKWGEFNERHLGIIEYDSTRGKWGYVDLGGIAHAFIDYTRDRETSPGVYAGLDSAIELGYIRPPGFIEQHTDTLLEMQEILLGGEARPSWSQPIIVDLGELPDAGEIGIIAKVDFVNEVYQLNGIDVPLAQLLDGVDYDDRTEFGLKSGGSIATSVPVAATDLLEAFTANIDAGITIVTEWGLVPGRLNATNSFSTQWFMTDTVDPDLLTDSASIHENENPGVTLDDGNWIYIEHTGLAHKSLGITRTAIILNKDHEGEFRHGISENGSTPEYLDDPNEFSIHSGNLAKWWFGHIPQWSVYFDYNPNYVVGGGFIGAGRSAAFLRKIYVYDDANDALIQLRATIEEEQDTPILIGQSTLVQIADDTMFNVTNPEVESGDLMLITIAHDATLAPPTGWTVVESIQHTANSGHTAVANLQYLSVYKKIASISDSEATEQWDMNSSGFFSAMVTAWRKTAETPTVLNSDSLQGSVPPNNIMLPSALPATAFHQIGLVCSGFRPAELTLGGVELVDTEITIHPLDQWSVVSPVTATDQRMTVMMRELGPNKYTEDESDGARVSYPVAETPVTCVSYDGYGFISILLG